MAHGSIASTGQTASMPAPERVTAVLAETCKQLVGILELLDSIDGIMRGDLGATSGEKLEEPRGLSGFAFEVRRLAACLGQRLAAHHAYL